MTEEELSAGIAVVKRLQFVTDETAENIVRGVLEAAARVRARSRARYSSKHRRKGLNALEFLTRGETRNGE